MPRIYLDACCLNRPFDDQSQDRIRMEAEAVEIFLRRIQNKQDCWVGSDAIDYEVQQIPDPDRRRRIKDLLEHLDENFSPDDGVFDRARKLCQIGFEGMDSLHVACAEKARCEALLTTDDRMLRCAERNAKTLKVRVANPLSWLDEVTRT